MDEKIAGGGGCTENLASGAEQCHTAMIHVLAVERQYFMPCFAAVVVEAVAVSTCMLLVCMHVCVSAVARLSGLGYYRM